MAQSDIVEMADMRVIQGRSNPCFALESMLQVRIGTKVRIATVRSSIVSDLIRPQHRSERECHQ